MLTATALRAKTGVFLTAGWHNLAMLNFTIDPRVLEPHVPAGTELDFFHGQAYVSVVGFQFVNMNVLGIPVLFHRDFEEVNLRFYVIRQAPEGIRRGVVFLREIAPKWLVCTAARWFYNEKYVAMRMRQQVAESRVEYGWLHGERWNGLSVDTIGEALPPLAGSEEEFITEHYWGYSRQRDGGTMEYEVEHPPWRVTSASSVCYDCDVAEIYGPEFVPFLREPVSAFVADGSPVIVRRGQQI